MSLSAMARVALTNSMPGNVGASKEVGDAIDNATIGAALQSQNNTWTGSATFTGAATFQAQIGAGAPAGNQLLNLNPALATTSSSEVSYLSESWSAHTITGSYTNQRYNIFTPAQTIAASSAQTITTTATVAISGAPVAGSNVTFTNSWSLWVQSGNSLFQGNVSVNRFLANQGSQYAVADGAVVLSAGWGTTASFAVKAGSTDSRGQVTVTSAGTGQAANPTVTITFKDGTWTTAPFAFAQMQGGTGTLTQLLVSTTATVLTITFAGTPVAASTYILAWSTEN